MRVRGLGRKASNATIVSAVLVLHALALWGLQSGLLQRVVEVLVPVELLAQLVEPPRAKPAPPAPPPPIPPPQKPAQPKLNLARTSPPVQPQLLAIADPTPAPNAPVGVTTPQPAPASIAAPAPATAAPAPAIAAPPAPPAKVELPSSDAEYLHNPRPPYPSLSRRQGEQGQVLLRVFIGTDGIASRAEIKQSSGFDRLDQSALATVQKWRYVPGKRGGVAEAMWFVVPVNFVLE